MNCAGVSSHTLKGTGAVVVFLGSITYPRFTALKTEAFGRTTLREQAQLLS